MTNSSTPPARLTPPVGGFQEISGRRVFAHRSGGGGPAVVFLAGAGAVGLDYFGVQQEVSRFTTAVVYDRGGTGYSDPLPLPRTAGAVAVELRELLRAMDIAAPYVLVPHSLGGLHAHRFTQLYPRDVAGLVWLDGLHRDWDEFMPPAVRLAETERGAPGPEQLERMRPALREMRAELLADYPDHVRQPLIDAHDSDGWIRVGSAERGALVELAAELRAGPDLPDVPVIALSVLAQDETRDGRRRMDAALVGAVTHGEQRTLSDTLHHRLCFDRPDAVVQAIRDVVDRVARPRTRHDHVPRTEGGRC
ncbi:alpha/beta hydrolase fold [Actinokineospora spheciospongiae]|uniref:Alpha/beta hydrolase fold n=1 Tax=Actinokineospora spheciospongiae TaxID=909613 RepID=W7JA06_9PSEU|nr:alpha/beta hydrolase [Actinokineospora spheciospongiae]EWC62879.1 alpha/beta hydrolase fold [Actinokineospora spheciospongiae]